MRRTGQERHQSDQGHGERAVEQSVGRPVRMSPRVQCLTGDGTFNAEEVAAFLTAPARHQWGSRYRTVAIMGPQSSGKSTLLNQLFGTAFVEMDALCGRSRTTQGVWLAQATAAEDPPLLVLDLEVRERASRSSVRVLSVSLARALRRPRSVQRRGGLLLPCDGSLDASTLQPPTVHELTCSDEP
jgi:hypothetical protein